MRELRLLQLLMAHADRVVTREQIRDSVWGGVPGSNTITVHVQRLRQRLGDDQVDPRVILTVRGVGYRLVAATAGRPRQAQAGATRTGVAGSSGRRATAVGELADAERQHDVGDARGSARSRRRRRSAAPTERPKLPAAQKPRPISTMPMIRPSHHASLTSLVANARMMSSIPLNSRYQPTNAASIANVPPGPEERDERR